MTNINKPIQISRFADLKGDSLFVKPGALPTQMHMSDGTGLPLIKDGGFGADLIRFDAGKGVRNHTHEGAHILFVLKGNGFVEYNGVDHTLEPGVCYFVPSFVEHAIKATTELVLIAVGNDHRSVGSKDRLEVVEK
jgi:quercetin dioxygenase-like cupin family protein